MPRDEEAISAVMEGVHPLYRKAIKMIADGRFDDGRKLLAQFHALPETQLQVDERLAERDQAAAESTE